MRLIFYSFKLVKVNSINIALGSSSVPAKNWASRLVIFGFLFFAYACFFVSSDIFLA